MALIILSEYGQLLHDLTGVALLRLREANAFADAHDKKVEALELSRFV